MISSSSLASGRLTFLGRAVHIGSPIKGFGSVVHMLSDTHNKLEPVGAARGVFLLHPAQVEHAISLSDIRDIGRAFLCQLECFAKFLVKDFGGGSEVRIRGRFPGILGGEFKN